MFYVVCRNVVQICFEDYIRDQLCELVLVQSTVSRQLAAPSASLRTHAYHLQGKMRILHLFMEMQTGNVISVCFSPCLFS